MKLDLSKIQNPFLLVLIGHPLVGKDTFIRNLPNDIKFNIISRDDIILNISEGLSYNEAYHSVDMKNVDRQLKSFIKEESESHNNVIINMTNMRSKRRTKLCKRFKNHYKVAVVFEFLSEKEFKERNQKRSSEEDKFIPLKVYKDMISEYQIPTKEEGFDKIVFL
jgi:predicted kinase